MLDTKILTNFPQNLQKNIATLDGEFVQDTVALLMITMEQNGIGFNHVNSEDNLGRTLKALCCKWFSEKAIETQDYLDIKSLLIKASQTEIVQVLEAFVEDRWPQ